MGFSNSIITNVLLILTVK